MTSLESGAPGRFISVAVPRPLDGLFTYRIPENAGPVAVGSWVEVSFGKGKTHAFVVESEKNESQLSTDFPVSKIKEVSSVHPEVVVPEDVLKLCRFASDYYQAPLGEVLNVAVPAASLGLRSKRQEAKEKDWDVARRTAGKVAKVVDLTSTQRECVKAITEVQGATTFLLHGVTGSGKTEVYLTAAREILARGKSVLLLVPEIALTPQLHERMETGLGVPVALWHSAMAAGHRRDETAAIRSGKIRVVVGARSAVFAPLMDLGLIIVDEEHDVTYKQEDRVRYQARDLAVFRGKSRDCPVVLGSATPSLETLERVREGKYRLISMPDRVGGGQLPLIEVVDLQKEVRISGIQAPIAEKTLNAIRDTVARGEQAIVFLNRRGYASSLVCEDCGNVPECKKCSLALTVHKKSRLLKCHWCGYQESTPDICVKCHGSTLNPTGAGTESLEEQIPQLLEGIRVFRLDRDQITSATRLEKTLSDFREKKADVLLGTQMLVKGHDFPSVTLVVVILADALFSWPDFRAAERAYQILTQVSGRAGRASAHGRVLVQTFQPEHPVIETLLGRSTVEDFVANERQLRETLGYPPFGRIARIRVEDEVSGKAQRTAEGLVQGLGLLPETVQILGPSPAHIERIEGVYRWDFVIRTKEIRVLHQVVHQVRKMAASKDIQVLIDVDPYGMG